MSCIDEVVLADPRFDAIPGWDDFVDRHGLGVEWHGMTLRAAAWTTQHRSLLAAVRGDGRLPAALFHCRLIGPVRPDRFTAGHRSPPLGLIEVSRPPGAHPGFALTPGSGRSERRDFVTGFIVALRHRLGRRPFGLAFRHVDTKDLRWLADRGSVVLRVQPAAVLDNRWESVEEYLASLHRNRRKNIRRLRRSISGDAGLVTATETSIDPAAAARLVELVRHRHRRPWLLQAPLSECHLAALTAASDTWFTTYRDAASGRLLAFGAWRDTPAAIVDGLWGAEDTAAGSRRDVYFDATFRSVEVMIERCRPRLLMGKGMTDIKASFGARLEPQYTVLRPLC